MTCMVEIGNFLSPISRRALVSGLAQCHGREEALMGLRMRCRQALQSFLVVEAGAGMGAISGTGVHATVPG